MPGEDAPRFSPERTDDIFQKASSVWKDTLLAAGLTGISTGIISEFMPTDNSDGTSLLKFGAFALSLRFYKDVQSVLNRVVVRYLSR